MECHILLNLADRSINHCVISSFLLRFHGVEIKFILELSYAPLKLQTNFSVIIKIITVQMIAVNLIAHIE